MASGIYIPLDKSIKDFQDVLRESTLEGKSEMCASEIVHQLRKEPFYNIDKVIRDVVDALTADNEKTNCLTGNNTEHVVVTKEKLDQIVFIIENGGMENVPKRKTSSLHS